MWKLGGHHREKGVTKFKSQHFHVSPNCGWLLNNAEAHSGLRGKSSTGGWKELIKVSAAVHCKGERPWSSSPASWRPVRTKVSLWRNITESRVCSMYHLSSTWFLKTTRHVKPCEKCVLYETEAIHRNWSEKPSDVANTKQGFEQLL